MIKIKPASHPELQIDKKTGARSKRAPMFVKSGGVVTCIIEVEQPICCETFETAPQVRTAQEAPCQAPMSGPSMFPFLQFNLTERNRKVSLQLLHTIILFFFYAFIC